MSSRSVIVLLTLLGLGGGCKRSDQAIPTDTAAGAATVDPLPPLDSGRSRPDTSVAQPGPDRLPPLDSGRQRPDTPRRKPR